MCDERAMLPPFLIQKYDVYEGPGPRGPLSPYNIIGLSYRIPDTVVYRVHVYGIRYRPVRGSSVRAHNNGYKNRSIRIERASSRQ